MSPSVSDRITHANRRMVLGCALVVALFAVFLLLLWLVGLILRELDVQPAIVRARPQLLVAAGVLTVVWLSLMVGIRVARQPRTPPEGPATSTLRPETPAVANMLCENFKATRESVAATLLDMAARGFVDIEGTDPTRTICRIRDRDDSSLTPYEQQVMEVLRKRAVRGVVPAGALTTGTEADAREWWRAFRTEVESEARNAGLSRNLWDTRTLWLLAGLALLPSPLVGLAYFEFGPAIAAAVPGLALISYSRTRNRQRDTEAGLQAASGWLGVRRYLRDDAAFPDLPPGAVTVWERYLAYGAALGAARGTVRALPLGAEDDHLAWSTHGGVWREVRVRYRSVWPPAWGASAVGALLASVGVGLFASLALWGASAIGWPDPDPSVPSALVTFVRWLVIVMIAVGTLAAVWAIPTFARAIGAFGRPREVTGQIVRLRTFGKSDDSPGRHHVAIDDGRADRIRAYRIPEGLWGRSNLSQYGQAVAQVTDLGRVVTIRMT